MEISLHSHLNSNTVIATKFCTWHDSCAVVACAKICCDLMASDRIRARQSFHRIWIAGKKSLVKWAPGPCFPRHLGFHLYVPSYCRKVVENLNLILRFFKTIQYLNVSVLIQQKKKWVMIINGSGNGLSPVQCQAITRPNDELLSSGPSARNF